MESSFRQTGLNEANSNHINEYPWPWYPEKPEDFEISQSDWEAFCRDMEEMRQAYELAVYGEVS